MLRNLILTRDLSQPDASQPTGPPPTELLPILETTDVLFPALNQFCASNGFPADWPARMLGNGAQALLTFDSAAPVATAWFIRKPFYLEEVRRTFDAGPDADYYFGDFVAPNARGRRLQRALIERRLHLSREAGRRWAIALTRDDNAASLNSYTSSGFVRAAELRSHHLWRFQLDRFVRYSPAFAAGSVSPAGLSLPLGMTLRRRS
jgi:GNAT superfamily N-acetyltransferase